ncbi:putative transposase, partial [Neisseria meningitidis 69166]
DPETILGESDYPSPFACIVGIMRKACRNRPLSETQTKRDRYLSKTRGDVFEPVESRQQAKCARCRPKGDRMPDYRVSRED